MKVKLSQYAKLYNITYSTAFSWYQNNLIKEEVVLTPSGSIFVIINDEQTDLTKQLPVYIYSRVSSHNKREDLTRQLERCKTFAETKGFTITKMYKEIGSGMNDSRGQLMKLLEQPIGTIIVENKDRLTRFGYNYLDKLYTKLGGKIIIVNSDEKIDKDDLMKDLTSVITSFCCKLYGLRGGYHKARSIKDKIDNNEL